MDFMSSTGKTRQGPPQNATRHVVQRNTTGSGEVHSRGHAGLVGKQALLSVERRFFLDNESKRVHYSLSSNFWGRGEVPRILAVLGSGKH